MSIIREDQAQELRTRIDLKAADARTKIDKQVAEDHQYIDTAVKIARQFDTALQKGDIAILQWLGDAISHVLSTDRRNIINWESVGKQLEEKGYPLQTIETVPVIDRSTTDAHVKSIIGICAGAFKSRDTYGLERLVTIDISELLEPHGGRRQSWVEATAGERTGRVLG